MTATAMTTLERRDQIRSQYLLDQIDRDDAIAQLVATGRGMTQKRAANLLDSGVAPSRIAAGVPRKPFEYAVTGHYLPALLGMLREILANVREIAAELRNRGSK